MEPAALRSYTAVMVHALLVASVILAFTHDALGEPAIPTGRERVVGLPCDGCEAVFDGMPRTLLTAARIAPEDEPGEPLVIVGTVRDAEGRPVAGVVVYAYQTDASGIYRRGNGAETA